MATQTARDLDHKPKIFCFIGPFRERAFSDAKSGRAVLHSPTHSIKAIDRIDITEVFVHWPAGNTNAAMLAEATKGQSNEGQSRSFAVISKTKLYTDVKIDSSDPRGVVYRLFSQMLSGNLKLDELKSLVYIDPENSKETLDQKEFQKIMSAVRRQISISGLPVNVTTDFAISNMHCTVEGDDNSGYKVTVEVPGAAAQDIFVVRVDGTYKIVAFSSSADTTNTEDLGWLVLRELKKNNIATARIWLDRARERIQFSSGDDPLSGPLFPHFWTKAQDADAVTMRTAALVLLPANSSIAYLADLKDARDKAKTDNERTWLTLKIAYVYSAAKRWDDLLSESQALLTSNPSSIRAFGFAAAALRQLKRYDDWDKLVHEKMKKYPDELAYNRSGAALEMNRGNVDMARTILKAIIDKGKATETDLNLYAWYALLLSAPITDETIEMAHRATDLSKNNFGIIHTLACVYAQAGKTSQARENLLKAMEVGQLEEPNSAAWLGFGLIAEQYGVADAAESMYRRVEKDEIESTDSNYAIAQQHLLMLSRLTKPPAPTKH